MKSNLLRICSIAGISFCSINANADHVLPQFSGYWFTDAIYQYMDACSNSNFTYNNKIQGDAASVATQLLSNVTPRTDCEWSTPQLMQDVQFGPADFVGSNADWAKIIADKSNAHIMVWGRSCKDKQGRILDGKSVKIQPAYMCPPGTVRSFDTQSPSGDIGCTSTPAACRSDVMGRDLNLSGFGDLGHVSLAQPGFTSGMVLEVLKTPTEGIFSNSMDSFKNFPNSPYWGDKSGLPDLPILTLDQATKIISAGIAQGSFPFEYTLTWDWHPGSFSSQYVLNQQTRAFEAVTTGQSAKFRCDSFVYYTYLAGANLHIIPDFGMPDVPKTLFTAMLACRDNQGKYCGITQDFDLAKAFNTNYSVAAVFNQPMINIHVADNSMKTYIEDQTIPRSVKLNYLWGLANQNSNDENKYGYILDSLSALHPIELIPDFISAFKATDNTSNQHKLVTAIFSALKQDDISVLNSEIDNVIQAQNFMRDVLLNNQKPEILRFVVQMYPSITTPDQAEQDINLFYQRKDMQKLLSDKEKALLQLRMAFSTPQTQSTRLPDMIAANKHNVEFRHALCFTLNNVPMQNISQDIKSSARNYLDNAKTMLVKSDDANNAPCDWLDAYATTSVNDAQQKDDFMLNYIRNENDGEIRARFLLKLSKPLFAKISAAERRHYQAELQQMLDAKQTAAPKDKEVLVNALGKVSAVKQ